MPCFLSIYLPAPSTESKRNQQLTRRTLKTFILPETQNPRWIHTPVLFLSGLPWLVNKINRAACLVFWQDLPNAYVSTLRFLLVLHFENCLIWWYYNSVGLLLLCAHHIHDCWLWWAEVGWSRTDNLIAVESWMQKYFNLYWFAIQSHKIEYIQFFVNKYCKQVISLHPLMENGLFNFLQQSEFLNSCHQIYSFSDFFDTNLIPFPMTGLLHLPVPLCCISFRHTYFTSQWNSGFTRDHVKRVGHHPWGLLYTPAKARMFVYCYVKALSIKTMWENPLIEKIWKNLWYRT